MTDEKKPRMPMHEGLPLQHLMERFPDLHKAEFDAFVDPGVQSAAELLSPTRPAEKILVTGLTAQCPRPHIGGLTGIVHFIEDEENGRWTTHGCDMGCPAAKVFEESRVMDARVPGEDDGEPQPEKKQTSSQRLFAAALKISRESLRKKPPPRKFMLRDANTGAGTFLQGTAGLFAAAGGTGKGWSLIQLAICCATGLTWFGAGGWSPVERIRVLHLGGEDDEEELERRIYYAAISAGAVSDEHLDLVAKNLTALPLFGKNAALTSDDSFQAKAGMLPETAFAATIRELLREAARNDRAYGLVTIDPFSRFAGFDAEKDNASATRWVQVIESFIGKATGRPSVMVAHHMKKRGMNDKADAGADQIRGASALKDGVRWAAVLEQQKRSQDEADLLTLRIVKANGIPPQLAPVVLCRDQKNEGALRLATPAESESHEKVASILKSKVKLIDNHKERVLAAFQAGHLYSRDDLVKLCGKRTLVLEAIRVLLKEGAICEPRKGVLALFVNDRELAGTGPGTGGGNGAGRPVPTPPPPPLGGEGGNWQRRNGQQPLDLKPAGTESGTQGTESGTQKKEAEKSR